MTFDKFLEAYGGFESVDGPRYLALKNYISDAIQTGKLLPKTALPSERELSIKTGLSRVTVRKAISELTKDGLIHQIPGSGSYVMEQPMKVEQNLSRLTSFTEDMRRRGVKTSSTWLSKEYEPPTPEESFILGISVYSKVLRLERLRSANDNFMAIERATIPAEFLPDISELGSSLYAALGKNDYRPVRAMQKLSATNLKKMDSDLLELPIGTAGLKIERISYLEDDRIVEWTRSIYRGDAYDFVAELRF